MEPSVDFEGICLSDMEVSLVTVSIEEKMNIIVFKATGLVQKHLLNHLSGRFENYYDCNAE
jgi:hypothetical protein